MDFEMTEAQSLLKSAIERLVKKEIEPFLATFPEDQPIPRQSYLKLLQILRPFGLLGARVPKDKGGEGMDFVSVGIAMNVCHPP